MSLKGAQKWLLNECMYSTFFTIYLYLLLLTMWFCRSLLQPLSHIRWHQSRFYGRIEMYGFPKYLQVSCIFFRCASKHSSTVSNWKFSHNVGSHVVDIDNNDIRMRKVADRDCFRSCWEFFSREGSFLPFSIFVALALVGLQNTTPNRHLGLFWGEWECGIRV